MAMRMFFALERIVKYMCKPKVYNGNLCCQDISVLHLRQHSEYER